MSTASREVHLATRPAGRPTESNFSVVGVEMGDPAPGQILVRNTYMSVDPYMRPRMDDVKSYIPPFQIGAPLDGGAIGEVIASASDRFAVGDLVLHALGWREYALVPERGSRKLDHSATSVTAYLGVLGIPGLTGYIGLLDVAELREGDVVFVSAAAGCVGSLVGQLAKSRGHIVIGSAGSAEKVAYLLDELCFDAAFDYHDGPVAERLATAAPDGIDVYFDNVGGDHLEAALAVANDHARFALCGAIAHYNQTDPPAGPCNLWLAVGKRTTMRGFIVSDHLGRMREFLGEVAPLVADGTIKHRETIVRGGVDSAPGALIDLLDGTKLGKMLVAF